MSAKPKSSVKPISINSLQNDIERGNPAITVPKGVVRNSAALTIAVPAAFALSAATAVSYAATSFLAILFAGLFSEPNQKNPFNKMLQEGLQEIGGFILLPGIKAAKFTKNQILEGSSEILGQEMFKEHAGISSDKIAQMKKEITQIQQRGLDNDDEAEWETQNEKYGVEPNTAGNQI